MSAQERKSTSTDQDLDGKVAIVTGASRGLGRAIAEGLAEAGADVVLVATNEEMLREVARDIEMLGRKALVFPCDVTHDEKQEEYEDADLEDRQFHGARPFSSLIVATACHAAPTSCGPRAHRRARCRAGAAGLSAGVYATDASPRQAVPATSVES